MPPVTSTATDGRRDYLERSTAIFVSIPVAIVSIVVAQTEAATGAGKACARVDSCRMKICPGRPYPLGATWDRRGVNFAIFAEKASRNVAPVMTPPERSTEFARQARMALWRLGGSDR